MKGWLVILFVACIHLATAQDANTLVHEADVLEKQFKEDQALDKYKQAATINASSIPVLVKCVELSCIIGSRQTDAAVKKTYFDKAKAYADQLLALNINSADANYAQALTFAKLTEVEQEKKKVVEDARNIKLFAEIAVGLDPSHAKANYVLGKWHYALLNLNWFKKAAMKTFYGGLPPADIDTAISYMEKCKTLAPYFVPNYLDLAKAYQYKNKPSQAIEVLNKLVKLPNRTSDDANIKAEGKKILDSLL